MAHRTGNWRTWSRCTSRSPPYWDRPARNSTKSLTEAAKCGLYPAGEGSTTASNDLILRLETPGLRALFLGAADAYALDALAGAGEPLAADVVELALSEGAPLDLDGPLGTVLRLAHPRLVVIASAPIPPRSAAAQRAATLYPWDTDSDAATTLGALIYRVDAAGTLVVSGGEQGWAIG